MGQKIFFCPNKQPYTFSKKTDFPRCILSQNARVILHLPSTVTRFLLRIIRANNAFDYDFRTRSFIHLLDECNQDWFSVTSNMEA